MASPSHIPLPPSPSPSTPESLRKSRSSSLISTQHLPSPIVSPRTLLRPRLDRNTTSKTIRQGGEEEPTDPFHEGSTISVNQPVGSLSISPSSRDVCLASRKGLYILDLANLNNAPRFIPQGGTWQIADCQWSPHPSTSNLILSTSSQKLLVWDLAAQRCLHRSIDAHARAITDINWHARNPHLMATVSMDSGIRGWDLRAGDKQGPVMRLCAWGAAGTQVKWNRQHDYLLATAHGKEVLVWDSRKGSVPVVSIKAHDAKIYGIDWDRRYRHKLVTCSLDKTIKYWTVPELGSSHTNSSTDFHPELPPLDQPTATISTTYPVWRARNLPFGQGVLALPQRGEKALEMFGTTNGNAPVETFEGHDDVVKEFVWRTRGGDDPDCEDREFQLVTWSKDRTLRIWPVGQEITEKVGYQYGAPISILVSRRGAPDITYTKDPDADEKRLLPPPMVNPNPSGISRQKMAKVETGMTRGGARARGMDQLEWLTKVVKNQPSPDSSILQSRIGSLSRPGSRATSVEGRDKEGLMSLKDEVVEVNRAFPRPRINFEKIDLHHRKLTISMNGPWANGDRMAFMRIHWSFPLSYPYSNDSPTFELERNPTVSPITRQKIVATLKELRGSNRQCLIPTLGYLLGVHERMGRRLLINEAESDSESESGLVGNVPMLIRTCGATFGPGGQLVCFFPKQTVLPRTRGYSRSPSVTRYTVGGPLAQAISALSRLENPNKRGPIRIKPRFRRIEPAAPAVQAGSTLTIHDVAHLGHPDPHLAAVYSTSIKGNLAKAVEARRLDHAAVWSAFQGLLSDPPPPYARHAPYQRNVDARSERDIWERGVIRKRLILDNIFATLIAARDIQLLALVSIILLEHIHSHPPPPAPTSQTIRSPEEDYFTLPRYPSRPAINTTTSNSATSAITPTPTRHRSITSISMSPSQAPAPASVPSIPGASSGSGSYKTSGWSQILNNSSLSIRGAMTPRDKTSFGDLPFAKTPLGVSYEESVSPPGLPIPPNVKSPGVGAGVKSRSSPPLLTMSAAGRSGSSRMTSGFVGQSPLRRISTQRTGVGGIEPAEVAVAEKKGVSGDAAKGKARGRCCSVKIEILTDEAPEPSLLPQDVRAQCEDWKFAYADHLLRLNLLAKRVEVLQYEYLDGVQWMKADERIRKAAWGEIPIQPGSNGSVDGYSSVCVRCASSTGECPACSERPRRPICVYCRLPIKGLSNCCTTCHHRTHATCFKRHFRTGPHPQTQSHFQAQSRPRSQAQGQGKDQPNKTCPACLCKCPETGGLTGSTLSFPVKPITTTAEIADEGRRITYTSLAKVLGQIRENDRVSRGEIVGTGGVGQSGLDGGGVGLGFGTGSGAGGGAGGGGGGWRPSGTRNMGHSRTGTATGTRALVGAGGGEGNSAVSATATTPELGTRTASATASMTANGSASGSGLGIGSGIGSAMSARARLRGIATAGWGGGRPS